ncbi:hypothetical protein ACS0TY_032503 [Phlomoides rotata]
MVVGNSSKKTQGRRKIEIKKIQKYTFSKRRTGLFNKASELALLYSAQIAILVQSPAEKIFSAYEEAVMRLEREKWKEKEFWWNEPHEGLELHELEEYLEALQTLKDNISKRMRN